MHFFPFSMDYSNSCYFLVLFDFSKETAHAFNNSAVFILAFNLVPFPSFLEGFVLVSLNLNCLLS